VSSNFCPSCHNLQRQQQTWESRSVGMSHCKEIGEIETTEKKMFGDKVVTNELAVQIFRLNCLW
jgi:Zn ribbon nucleic-acid-binding protein